MASRIIRARWFNRVLAAKAGAARATETKATPGSAIVTIYFDEPLRAAPVSTQFTATVGGVARVVNTTTTSGSRLTVTLASAVNAGQNVVITYVANGTPAQNLADAAGTSVANFVTSDVA